MKTNSIHKKIWILMILVWLVQAVTQIIGMSWGMVMPSMMADLNLSYDVMGNIAGMGSLLCMILTIPLSVIVIKLSPRWTLPLVFLLVGVGYILGGLAQSAGMAYVGKIMSAGLVQVIATVLTVIKANNVPQERITLVNGIENFVGPMGQLAGTAFVTSLMVFLGGWRNLYHACGIVLIVIAVLYLVAYGNGSHVNLPAQPAKDANTPKGSSALLGAWKNKTLWPLCIAWPGMTIAWIAMFYYWPSYAQSELGLSANMSGIILAMIPLFSAIGSLTAPFITNKLGYDKPVIVGAAVGQTVCYLAMMKAPNVPFMFIATCLAGFFGYVNVPPAFSVIYKVGIPARSIPLAYSTLMTFLSFGQVIAGSLIGMLVEHMGLYNGLIIATLTPLWFAILTLIFIPELGRKKMEAMAAAAQGKQ